LRSNFCLDFFPIHKVINLRAEVITFKQKNNKSLAITCDRFNLLLKSGPDLELQDHILLQHFYMGLNTKTTEFLTLASGGSLLHLSI
jgi:hypothetical protein